MEAIASSFNAFNVIHNFSLQNSDIGATHVCLLIDDMDAAYETLLSRGAVFNAPPVTLTDGVLAGSRWAYLRDPDGIQLEIWAMPKQ